MTIMKLTNFYASLALISTLAATQSIIFPRWPEATKISSQKLNHFKGKFLSNGYVIKSLPTLADHSDYSISHTPIFNFMVGPYAKLSLTNVQVRDRKNLKVSYITDSLSKFQLKSSATKSNQPPYFLTESTSEGTSFQTCLVSNTSFPLGIDVDQDQLAAAVDSVKSPEKNLLIKRFLGLSPSRTYQCMLVTLKTSLPAQQGSKLWLELLTNLKDTFN